MTRLIVLLLCIVLALPSRAGLDFSVDAADHVDHGSDSTLDNLDTGTLIFMVYLNSVRANDRFWFKSAGAGTIHTLLVSGAGDLNLTIQGATSLAKTTSTTPLAVGWNYIGIPYQFGTTNGGIYHGTLTTAATSQALATNTAGATPGSAASANYMVGGSGTAQNIQGTIAWMMHLSGTVSTLAQVNSIRLRPRPLAGCVLFVRYGLSGATAPNLCGPGSINNGTVNGAIASFDVPIGAAFAKAYQWLWDRAYAHLA